MYIKCLNYYKFLFIVISYIYLILDKLINKRFENLLDLVRKLYNLSTINN